MAEEGKREIMLAIREGLGRWEASEGEVVEDVLVIRRANRKERCCGRGLSLVASATRGTMSWELRRCLVCEREYSIGPALPSTWVTALARRCIELHEAFQVAVAAAYGQSRG